MILLKDGKILGADGLIKADLLIDGSKIVRIESSIADAECETVYLDGGYVMPAAIDVHTHLREPGYEYKETVLSGSLSAAKGGFGTIMPMPNLNPVPDNEQNLSTEQAILDRDSVVRAYPYAALTVGEKGETPADIRALSAKVKAFSDDGRCVNDAAVLEHCMREVAAVGGIIASHAESSEYAYDDPRAESAAVEREIESVRKTGCRYHFCHLSTKASFDAVREAQADGLDITVEVMPHHLFLCDEDINGDTNAKMNPPLRSREDMLCTRRALLDGTASIIATDHAPHSAEDKNKPYSAAPNGIIGLETAIPLVYTYLVDNGAATLKQMQAWFVINPSKRFGLPCGSIEVGGNADITVLNLEREREYTKEEILSKSANTPFIGTRMKGFPILTIVGGKIVYNARRTV